MRARARGPPDTPAIAGTTRHPIWKAITMITIDGTSADSDLLVAVETLSVVHDRFDSAFSDSTGTSAGDDGDNKDHNFPGRG